MGRYIDRNIWNAEDFRKLTSAEQLDVIEAITRGLPIRVGFEQYAGPEYCDECGKEKRGICLVHSGGEVYHLCSGCEQRIPGDEEFEIAVYGERLGEIAVLKSGAVCVADIVGFRRGDEESRTMPDGGGEAEWYCTTDTCIVREVVVHVKILDRDDKAPPSPLKCPVCRKAMKFHGWISLETLVRVRGG